MRDQFRYNCLRTKMHSYTLFGKVKAKSGNVCDPFFVNDKGF